MMHKCIMVKIEGSKNRQLGKTHKLNENRGGNLKILRK